MKYNTMISLAAMASCFAISRIPLTFYRASGAVIHLGLFMAIVLAGLTNLIPIVAFRKVKDK